MPGWPFQLVSWLTYRFTGEKETDGSSVVDRDPQWDYKQAVPTRSEASRMVALIARVLIGFSKGEFPCDCYRFIGWIGGPAGWSSYFPQIGH